MKKGSRRKIVFVKAGLKILLLIGITAGGFLGARFLLQALFLTDRSEEIRSVSATQLVTQNIRRSIYDRNFKELAVSFELNSVYAFPIQIEKPQYTAERLAEVLGLEGETVLKLLKKKQNVVWIAQNVEPATASKLRDLDLQGIKIEQAEQRYYPKQFSAAHVVGFLKENQGIAGIECFYDSVLNGGPLSTAATTEDLFIPQKETISNTSHLVLTIDLRIQELIEEKLNELIENTSSRAAKAVVMAVDTGEILGMANQPSFNPNRFWDFDESARSNRVVSELVHGYIVDRLFQFSEKIATDGQIPNELIKQIHAGSQWKQMKKGIYFSPEVAWKQAFTGERKTNSQKKELLNTTVDLPQSLKKEVTKFDDEDAPTMLSTLELAEAISFLANDGGHDRPHLLSGFWNESVGELYSLSTEFDMQDIEVQKPRGNSKLFTQLPHKDDTDLLVVESLVDVSAFNNKSLNNPYSNKEQPQQNEDVIVGGGGFQSVLVALTPADKPEIAIVVVLDQAKINPKRPSPVRDVGYEIADSILRWSRDIPITPAADYQKTRIAKFYNEWKSGIPTEKEKEQIFTVAALPLKEEGIEKSNIMPDLKGYSLRKALQELQEYDLDINIDGSGWVMDQIPQAGVVLDGKECVLKLSMLQEEMIRNILVQ